MSLLITQNGNEFGITLESSGFTIDRTVTITPP